MSSRVKVVVAAAVFVCGTAACLLQHWHRRALLNDELFHAILANDAAGATRAVGRGADPNEHYHVLYPDASRGGLDWLLRRFDPSRGISLLTLAAERGQAKVVRACLSGPLNVDVRSAGSQTALMAAARSGSIETVECLVKHGANVNVEDDNGTTPLMCAVFGRNASVVRFLLRSGANARARSRSGMDAERFAEKMELWDIARLIRDSRK